MPILTIPDLPDAIHRGLQALAARHGRSTEAEAQAILAGAVRPGLTGAALVSIWEEVGGLDDEEIALLESVRERNPAKPFPFAE